LPLPAPRPGRVYLSAIVLSQGFGRRCGTIDRVAPLATIIRSAKGTSDGESGCEVEIGEEDGDKSGYEAGFQTGRESA
jgi:hypothetical protein